MPKGTFTVIFSITVCLLQNVKARPAACSPNSALGSFKDHVRLDFSTGLHKMEESQTLCRLLCCRQTGLRNKGNVGFLVEFAKAATCPDQEGLERFLVHIF